jgi:sugar phosphate isomerase/epimerase
MYSRRQFGRLALVALPAVGVAAQKIDSTVRGIQFGLQSYVFSGLGIAPDAVLDVVIGSMVESSLGNCDLYAPLIQPADILGRIRSGPASPANVSSEVAAVRGKAREELAQWYLNASLDYFRGIRKKFEDAGIAISALSRFPASTETELVRTFEVAQAVGARIINTGLTVSAARRLAPLADRHNFTIGIMGGSNMNSTDPDAVGRPEPFAQAVSFSKNYGMSFDIGDSTAGGYDALKFVEDHHEKIALLYLKDRRKTGEKVPFGEGDAPLAQVLRLVRDRKYPIPLYIDCDHSTSNRPVDVKRSFEYAKAVLA